MYGYYGAGYDLGDYEGDDMDMGELDGFMDVLKKDVAFGIPVWGVLAGLAGLALFTKKGKSVLGGLMGTAKKNPRRRRSRKAVSMKMNRRRKNGAMKMNRRRRSRRSRR